MNDPIDYPPTDEETPVQSDSSPTILRQAEKWIRRHPLAATLATVGIGCAVGVAARELLTPEPTPRRRVVQLLEDIQDRLTEFTEPAYERASHLADEGVSAVRRGARSLSDSGFAHRLKHLFS